MAMAIETVLATMCLKGIGNVQQGADDMVRIQVAPGTSQMSDRALK